MASRRRTIFTGLATVIGASVLAGCSVVGPVPFVDSTASNAAVKPVAVPLRERTGISAGSSILWERRRRSRSRKLQAIADSGARWFEIDIDWNSIQAGGQDSFDWDATDRGRPRRPAPAACKILGMVGYSPGLGPPGELPAQHRQVPAGEPRVLRRRSSRPRRSATAPRAPIPSLRGSISAWQIWNEPNHYPFVQPTVVDVGMYTRMLKRAYVEIKQGRPRRHGHRRRHRTRTGRPVRPRHVTDDVPQPHLRERREGLLRRLRPPPVLVPLQPADQGAAGTRSPRPSTSTT